MLLRIAFETWIFLAVNEAISKICKRQIGRQQSLSPQFQSSACQTHFFPLPLPTSGQDRPNIYEVVTTMIDILMNHLYKYVNILLVVEYRTSRQHTCGRERRGMHIQKTELCFNLLDLRYISCGLLWHRRRHHLEQFLIA